MFQKFEDFTEKNNPLDLLIRDDATLVEFSKAFRDYKNKKQKNRKEAKELDQNLKNRFQIICSESGRSVSDKDEEEEKLYQKFTRKGISHEEADVIIDMRRKLKIDFKDVKLNKDYWLCKMDTEEMADKLKK